MDDQEKNDFINFIINNCFNPEDTKRVKNIILRFFKIFEKNEILKIDKHAETFKMIIRFIKDLYLTPEQSLETNKSVTINKCMVDEIQYVKYNSVAEQDIYGFKINY